MRKKLPQIFTLLIALILVMSTTAFAATDLSGLDASSSDDNDVKLYNYIVNNYEKNKGWINNYLTTDTSKADTSAGSITLGSETYYVRSDKSYSDFENRLSQAYRSSTATDKTMGITNGLKIEADTTEASNMLSGVVPVVNIVLGVIVVLITVGLAVFTAFDVCYITMPVFRDKCEDSKVQGTGPMVKKTANGGTKLRFVTDEAIYAVNNCSLENGKNPLTAYLGKRVIAYVAVSIILFILLTGNISIITNIALKVIQGLMDVLQGLA